MKHRPAKDQVIEVAPDRLEVRSGGGCISVFGFPFFAAGILLLLTSTGIIRPTNADDLQSWVWLLLFFMGLVFTAVGGGLLFGRSWKTIDRSRGSVSLRWGLLVPMKETEQSLQQYSEVAVRFVAGDSDSVDRYPVVLQGTLPVSELTLCTFTEYPKALDQAELIARFLRFPLKDQTTDHESLVRPGAVSSGLRTGQGAVSEPPWTVSPPPVLRSTVQESAQGVTITIPTLDSAFASALQVLIPVGVALFMALILISFFRNTDTPAAVQWIFLGIAMLMMMVPLTKGIFRLLKRKRSGTSVSVSPGCVTITVERLGRSRVTEIPFEKVLDVDYSTSQTRLDSAHRSASHAQGSSSPHLYSTGGRELPSWVQKLSRFVGSKGVTIKSRTGLFTFGQGLSDDEIQYLHYVVKKALHHNGKLKSL